MNVVINEKGERYKAIDIEEVAKSGKYNCVCCNEKMVFVNKCEIRNCHFRHYPKSKCITNTDKVYMENKKTEFHYDWQKIFPEKNIEVCFTENDIKHIADIYLENNNNKLVIEIQHSPISELHIKERNEFYTKYNRKLLWIFDIKNNSEIIKINTHDKDIQTIKFNKKIYFNTIPYNMLLLDNGGDYLYKINEIIDDDDEIITIKEVIDKKVFINNLVKEYDININYNIINSITNIKNYDFEKIILSSDIDNISKDKLQIILSLLSKNKFMYYDFKLLIKSLSTLSHKNKDLLDLINVWFKNNFYKKNITVKFGKYEGELYENINNVKIKNWYVENIDCDCDKKYENKKCNKCNVLTNCKIDSINYLFYNADNITNLDVYNCISELYNCILLDNKDPAQCINIHKQKKMSNYTFKPMCNYNLFVLLWSNYCELDKCLFCNSRAIVSIINIHFDICKQCFNNYKNDEKNLAQKIKTTNEEKEIQMAEKLAQQIKEEMEREEMLLKSIVQNENERILKESAIEKEKLYMTEPENNTIMEEIIFIPDENKISMDNIFQLKMLEEQKNNKIIREKYILEKLKKKNRTSKKKKNIIVTHDIFNYI